MPGQRIRLTVGRVSRQRFVTALIRVGMAGVPASETEHLIKQPVGDYDCAPGAAAVQRSPKLLNSQS